MFYNLYIQIYSIKKEKQNVIKFNAVMTDDEDYLDFCTIFIEKYLKKLVQELPESEYHITDDPKKQMLSIFVNARFNNDYTPLNVLQKIVYTYLQENI